MSGAAGDGDGAVERAERLWAILVFLIIALLLGMVAFTAVHWSSMPPSRVETVDATTLNQRGEFVQANLGTGIDPDNRVVLHLLAEQYAFRPHCLVVPEGVPVTVRATSADVVHGLQVLGTNINSMLVPGYISTFVVTLQGTGERDMPCHEFCGVGHASMWGRVRVIPQAEFERLARAKRRVSCD